MRTVCATGRKNILASKRLKLHHLNVQRVVTGGNLAKRIVTGAGRPSLIDSSVVDVAGFNHRSGDYRAAPDRSPFQ